MRFNKMKLLNILVYSILLNLSCNVKCEQISCENETKTMNDKFLQQVNHYRQFYSVDPVTLDDELVKSATEWSRELANLHTYKISNGTYGELIYRYNYHDSYPVSKYDYLLNVFGNFSQEKGDLHHLMWRNTTKIGCGYCTNISRNYNYVTCRYKLQMKFDKNTSTTEWESYPTREDAYMYTLIMENSTNEETEEITSNFTAPYSVKHTSIEILPLRRASSYDNFLIKTLVKVLISVTALVGLLANILVVYYVITQIISILCTYLEVAGVTFFVVCFTQDVLR